MHAVKAHKAILLRFMSLCTQHHLSSGLYFNQFNKNHPIAESDLFLFPDLDNFWLKLKIRLVTSPQSLEYVITAVRRSSHQRRLQ